MDHEQHDAQHEARKRLRLSDHLANERTHLAYLRTSVTLVAFGITLNRFSLYLIESGKRAANPREHWPLLDTQRTGLGMVVLGMLLMIWAAIRYAIVSRAIERQSYHPNPVLIWVITGV